MWRRTLQISMEPGAAVQTSVRKSLRGNACSFQRRNKKKGDELKTDRPLTPACSPEGRRQIVKRSNVYNGLRGKEDRQIQRCGEESGEESGQRQARGASAKALVGVFCVQRLSSNPSNSTDPCSRARSSTFAARPFFSSQIRPTANCLKSFRSGPTGSLRACWRASVARLLRKDVAISAGIFMVQRPRLRLYLTSIRPYLT